MDVQNVRFPDLEGGEKGGRMDPRGFDDLPLHVTVELGTTELPLNEILNLQEGSIIELARLAGEPLDIKVGDQRVAQGEVVAIDEKYGVRITNVLVKKD